MAAIQGAGVGRRIPALERWLGTAAALFGTDAALLVLSQEGTSRIVAGYGIRHPLISWRFDFRDAPYGPDDTVLIPDASSRPDIHAVLGDNALARTHFFFRAPVPFPGDARLALIAFGAEVRSHVGENQLRLAAEICAAIGHEFGDLVAPGKAELEPDSLGFVYDGLKAWILDNPTPLAVVDHATNLILANDALRALGPRLAGLKLGEDPFSLVPAGDVIRPMILRALRSAESTPEIEIYYEAPEDGQKRYFTVLGSPITLADRDSAVAVLSLREITREVLTHDAFESRSRDSLAQTPHPAEATVRFLADTLVQRRALRSRKAVSYVTARAWRTAIREHQIKALKLLKRSAVPQLAEMIAEDMLAELDALMGRQAFQSIVPVPCGHSAPGQCLSRHIALHLAHKLDIPVVDALRLPMEAEGSHPKKNIRRPPMQLSRPPEGPALVIDDVATSGAHVEEACTLLRGTGTSVMALVWISGNVQTD